MEYSDSQLKQLQSIELSMLKEFIKICEKENLRYYAFGGTALGAVRHNGFIPWDDDIDVGMPRADYQRFLEVAPSYLSEYYEIQSIYSDDKFPHNFAKIRDSRTTFLEKTVKNIDINHGVFIDIFPYDYYPDKHIRSFRLKNKLLTLYIKCIFYRANLPKAVNWLVNLPTKITWIHKKAVFAREKLYKSVPETDLMICYSGAYGDREIMPKEVFGEAVSCKFENIEIMLPSKVDEYLTRLYGDYMQLPPEDKRVGHHYTEVIDFDKSYTDYVKYN